MEVTTRADDTTTSMSVTTATNPPINANDSEVSENKIHLDRIDAPDWMVESFRETEEGYLKGRAVITTVGVYTYFDSEGNMIRELRLPEEVFNPDSLNTFRLLPITLDHPTVLVNADNVRNFQVGYTGDAPSSFVGSMDDRLGSDGLHVSNDIIITDRSAIQAVKSGKRALSAAYKCDLEPAESDAKWCGISYDYIQRNIRYNHVAVVDKARAGDAARIRLDSAEAQHILIREEVPMAELKKVTLDGVEYQAEADVLKALNKSTERLDTLQKELNTAKGSVSQIEADRDTYKERCDELQTQIDELKANHTDQAEIDQRVERLLRVRSVAQTLQVEVKDGMSEMDMMKAVVMRKFPNAKLDDKDEIYVRSRFDSVEEILESEKDAGIRAVGVETPTDRSDSSDSPAEAARQRMLGRMRKKEE